MGSDAFAVRCVKPVFKAVNLLSFPVLVVSQGQPPAIYKVVRVVDARYHHDSDCNSLFCMTNKQTFLHCISALESLTMHVLERLQQMFAALLQIVLTIIALQSPIHTKQHEENSQL